MYKATERSGDGWADRKWPLESNSRKRVCPVDATILGFSVSVSLFFSPWFFHCRFLSAGWPLSDIKRDVLSGRIQGVCQNAKLPSPAFACREYSLNGWRTEELRTTDLHALW